MAINLRTDPAPPLENIYRALEALNLVASSKENPLSPIIHTVGLNRTQQAPLNYT